MSSGSGSSHRSRAKWRDALRTAGAVAGVVFLVVVALGVVGVVVLRMNPPDHGPTTLASVQASGKIAVASATATRSATASAGAGALATTRTPASAVATSAPLPFDADRAMVTVEKLAGEFGVRKGGGTNESRAADYVEAQLKGFGYKPVRKAVSLPDGSETVNVYASRPGSGKGTVIVGAHLDSKSPSPGANDSASGCGVVLELARDLALARVTPTVTFVFFGTEEMVDSNADHHHYGSRAFVEDLSKWQRGQTAAMLSLDMVGWGSKMVIRTMKSSSQDLVDLVEKRFTAVSRPASYLKDTSQYGWSDHEPFELAAIPAVWLQWWDEPQAGVDDDPANHTSGDDVAHVQKSTVAETGRAVRTFLKDVTQEELDALVAR